MCQAIRFNKSQQRFEIVEYYPSRFTGRMLVKHIGWCLTLSGIIMARYWQDRTYWQRNRWRGW